MGEPGTNASGQRPAASGSMAGGSMAGGSMAGDFTECERMRDPPDAVLRARGDIEQVAIETVHVGDYVFLDVRARPVGARCVIKKCAKANERTARIVGWLLELTGGHLAWWPRGELVWRRRASVHA